MAIQRKLSNSFDPPLPPHLFEQMANAVVQGELVYRDGIPVDFIYLYVNPAFRRLTGISAVIGRCISDIVPEAQIRAPSLRLFDPVLRTGISESFEEFVPLFDRWYSVQVLRADDRRFLALFSDITARKNAEKALARTQALLKEAQSIARIGCWQLDLEANEFTSSEGMRELFGFRDEEVVDRHACENLVHPDDRPRLRSAFEEGVRTGLGLEVRHRIIGHEGSIRHCQVTGRIDRGDGGCLRLIGTTQDVTHLVLQEMALREIERRLTATIEASPAPLAFNDDHGRIVSLNAAFRRSFGYELSDIPSLDHWWPLAYPDPEYRLHVRQEWRVRLAKAHASATPFRPMEVVICAKDGSRRTDIVTTTSVDTASDGLHLVSLYDITERKNLEEWLRKQSADLQSVVDGSPNALAMFDADRRLISINRRFYEIHGIGPEADFTPEKGTFKDLIRFFHARGDYPGLSIDDAITLFAGYLGRREHVTLERPTNDGRVLEVDAVPLESGGTLLSYKDVTDRGRNLDDARAAALLLVDLDRLKVLNDSFRHIYGDLLLTEVADRLKPHVRGLDLVARLGGDEFVILLGGLPTCHADARLVIERIAEDIRRSLSVPYCLRPAAEEGGLGEQVYECSASIGGWVLPHDVSNLTSAIKTADEALYRAKSQGRNSIVIQ